MKISRPSTALHSVAAALAIALLAAANASASVTLSLTDSIGAPGSVTINPGDIFSFTLALNSDAESTLGLSYFFETTSASSAKFRLLGRDNTGSAYADFTTQNNIALQSSHALLDPRNDDDLGATTASGTVNGPGSFLVASYTVQALANLAPGSYTLQTSSDAIATDDSFGDVSLPVASYTVNVVPEPGSLALLALSALALGHRRRRGAAAVSR